MKASVKVEYVKADNLEELQTLTNKAIEAIQVNIKNYIRGVDLKAVNSNEYISEIIYEELLEDDAPMILNESEEVK